MTAPLPFRPPQSREKVTLDSRSRLLPGFGLLLWLGVIAFCTLQGSSPDELAGHKMVPWTCLVCGSSGATDVILNLLLFCPLGFLAARLGMVGRRVALYALALSLAIELTQAGWLVGRDATVSDVLSNTVGAVIGWWAAGLFAGGREAFTRRAPALGYGLLLFHGVIWFGTAWAMSPELTGPTPWWGYYTQIPDDDSTAYGDVVDADYQGVPLSGTKYAAFPFTPGGEHLGMTLSPAPEIPDGRIARLRVKQSDSGQIATVDQVDDVMILGLRARATRLLFRTPGWEFTGAADTGSTPREYRWDWTGGVIRLRISSPAGTSLREQDFPMSVTYGWALIHPFVTRLGPSTPFWSALWIGWWFATLGAMAAWCRRPAWVGYGAAALLMLLGAGGMAGWPVAPVEATTAVVAYLGALLVTLLVLRRGARRREMPTGR